MNQSTDHDAERRQFLTGGAAVGVLATVSVAHAEIGAQLETWLSPQRSRVLVRDARFRPADRLLDALGAREAQSVVLSGDPVWFWRSNAAAALREPATSLIGVTGWPELLVFSGLAAETGRRLRYEKQDADSGAFVWLIG